MTTDAPKEHLSIIADILATQLGVCEEFETKRLGGLTNFNYLVTTPSTNVVFRIPGEGTEELVDRAVECQITHAASDIGVDSELLYFNPENGIKVMALIPHALTMSQDLMKDKENLELTAQVLHKLHDEGASVDFRFDVFEMIPHYEQLIRQNQEIQWDGYEELRTKLYDLRSRLDESGVVLCHCDPLCENFVIDTSAQRMYLIDWEYGGMNDPLWDVADVIIESDFDQEQRDAFQNAYFGRPATRDEHERISINIVLIDFLWALWGLQRSYYDPSLDEYGPERYARALQNFEEFDLGNFK